jgi:hypothetical protein
MITNGKCRSHTLSMTEQLTRERNFRSPSSPAPPFWIRNFLEGCEGLRGATRSVSPLIWRPPDSLTGIGAKGSQAPTDGKNTGASWRTAFPYSAPTMWARTSWWAWAKPKKEMVKIMDRLWRMGVDNHLFSFFAEEGRAWETCPNRPGPLISEFSWPDISLKMKFPAPKMAFDEDGRIIDFGVGSERIETVIRSGIPS